MSFSSWQAFKKRLPEYPWDSVSGGSPESRQSVLLVLRMSVRFIGTWDASKMLVHRDREMPSPQTGHSLDSVNPEFETITDSLSWDPSPAAWRVHRVVIDLLDLPPRKKTVLNSSISRHVLVWFF